MAYFKKRRGKTLSKHEEREAKASRAESQLRMAGVLGSRFPSVKRLTMRVTFLDARKNPLDQKTLALGPSDPAVFKAACPGMCGHGTFDFSGKIAEAVMAGQSTEFALPCPEKQGAGTPCGCEAQVKLDLEFAPTAA